MGTTFRPNSEALTTFEPRRRSTRHHVVVAKPARTKPVPSTRRNKVETIVILALLIGGGVWWLAAASDQQRKADAIQRERTAQVLRDTERFNLPNAAALVQFARDAAEVGMTLDELYAFRKGFNDELNRQAEAARNQQAAERRELEARVRQLEEDARQAAADAQAEAFFLAEDIAAQEREAERVRRWEAEQRDNWARSMLNLPQRHRHGR